MAKPVLRKCILYILTFFLLFSSCNQSNTPAKKEIHDLVNIQKKGKLIALTDYNSTSYFIYRGTPMGYQYELLQNLAKHLNLELEIMVSNSLDDAFTKLSKNECDILAINLNITNERKNIFSFTEAIGQTRQILVQKKPDNWRTMSGHSLNKHLIRNQIDLGGKTVHIVKHSAFYSRLMSLQNEIGDSINIQELENYETEQLITLVDKGEIDFTVADENVAKLNQTYYPNIDVKTAISFPQNQAWAVNKNSELLLAEVNKWIQKMEGSSLHSVIYNKYFKNMKAKQRNQSAYMSIQSGKISDYDKYIKKYSKNINWDWRLLASLIYQESRFNPNIKSWAGAFGLMQLMPRTAKRFGASKASSPEINIKAGTKFIKWLNKNLKDSIPDKDERIKFILASYNAGMGHILDAQRLARANGKNPNIWTDNVDFFILNKSNPEYYDSKLVRHGYLRGHETYNYVKEVTERYEMYKKLIR